MSKNHNPEVYGKDIKVTYELVTPEKSSKLQNVQCGNEALDEYIAEHCGFDFGMVATLILNSDNNDVIGVYSLSASSMIYESHKKHYEIPAIEIEIFAINKKYQDIPYSKNKEDGCLSNNILSDLCCSILEFTDNVCGANFIKLYSTPDALDFYKRNGFVEFPEEMWRNDKRFLDGCTPLYMKIRECE